LYESWCIAFLPFLADGLSAQLFRIDGIALLVIYDCKIAQLCPYLYGLASPVVHPRRDGTKNRADEAPNLASDQALTQAPALCANNRSEYLVRTDQSNDPAPIVGA